MKNLIYMLPFFFSGVALSNDRLWTINVIGGGSAQETMEDFYTGGIDQYKAIETFGVSPQKKSTFFGPDPKKAKTCYSKNSDKNDTASDENSLKFFNHPEQCELAAPIIRSMFAGSNDVLVCSTKNHDLRDFDKDGKPDAAPATLPSVLTSLDNVIKNAPAGSHLLLNLNDHGLAEDGHWRVDLGQEDASITNEILNQKIRQLQSKGIIVHLDVQACFSGGFVKTLPASSTPTCGTASASADKVGVDDEDSFGMQWPANLKKYGNQLQAFACSFGHDTSNEPVSSLDGIVSKWRWSESGMKATLRNPCTVDSFDNISQKLSDLAQSMKKIEEDEVTTGLRQRLRESFIKNFVSVAEKCKNNDPSVALGRGLIKSVLACLESKKISVDPPEIQGYLESAFNQDAGDKYHVKLVKDHMTFIENAGAKELEDYRQNYCCLSYNFKTGSVPEICK